MRMYERLKALKEIADGVQKALGTSVKDRYVTTFYKEGDGSGRVGVKVVFPEPKRNLPHYTDLKKVIEETGADDVRPLYEYEAHVGRELWVGVELYWRE